MAGPLVLRADGAEAALLPEMGAGLATLSVGGRPVLRPWSGRAEDGPFALACNLLAPFSNRISGGFAWEGRRHDLAPNLPGEACPIHGDAFQRAWAVGHAGADRARLVLEDGAFGPWRYRAALDVALSPARLEMALSLTSRAEGPLPWGMGFHPWLPRGPQTRLTFGATGLWEEGAGHLPAGDAPVPLPPDLDFAAGRALPDGWINTAFDGWSGRCRIEQGAQAVPVVLEAGPPLGTLILYAPSAGAEFFCAEPVSHPVDAHNLPGRPGLVTLGPGETLSATMRLDWGAFSSPAPS